MQMAEEIRRFKRELVRVTEERDIQKKRPRTSPRMQSEVRVRLDAAVVVAEHRVRAPPRPGLTRPADLIEIGRGDDAIYHAKMIGD